MEKNDHWEGICSHFKLHHSVQAGGFLVVSSSCSYTCLFCWKLLGLYYLPCLKEPKEVPRDNASCTPASSRKPPSPFAIINNSNHHNLHMHWQPWKGSCKHLPSINMGVSSSRGFLLGPLRDLSIADAAGCLGAVGTALGHNGGMRWGQTVGFTAWDLAKGCETASRELPGTAALGGGDGRCMDCACCSGTRCNKCFVLSSSLSSFLRLFCYPISWHKI